MTQSSSPERMLLQRLLDSATEVEEIRGWPGDEPHQSIRNEVRTFLKQPETSSPEAPDLARFASRLLDLVEKTEWVRAAGGRAYVCPSCGGVSERYGGPGHQDECEAEMVRKEGNELRHAGVIP